jgi:hypothetical protein
MVTVPCHDAMVDGYCACDQAGVRHNPAVAFMDSPACTHRDTMGRRLSSPFHVASSMRRGIRCAAASLILVVAFLLTRGLDPPTPNPPGAFSFAVMGDAPYDWLEELRFRLVLEDLDAHDLTSVISIGDIFWRPCSDEMYRRTREQFNGLRHPVVYTPGDNEWFDPGSPDVGWVRVTVTPDARNPFAFENHVVPRWKHW